ncbi:Putative CMGC/CLK protein kinase [Rhizopus microsporus]|nr:Putative CMGC/CLK protein kinase [Rhizopus microsporus]
MGLGWSYPCDMWSMGCILIEFFIGDALFQTHDNLEHLAMMESVLGPIPTHMVTRASKEAQKLFEKDSKKLNYPLSKTSRQSKRLVSGLKPLDQIVPPVTIFNKHLNDLLKRLLVYEPSARISAREALRHPFFQNQCMD